MKKHSAFILLLAVFLSVQPLKNLLTAQTPTWQWAHTAGSTNWDFCGGIDYNSSTISTDAMGNSYITGLFNASAAFGTVSISSPLHPDVFVAKYDSSGNCLWAKQFGGDNTDVYGNQGSSISLDPKGNCYVTGTFHGGSATIIPFGSSQLTGTGGRQIFVAKYDASGNEQWARQPSNNSAINNYARSIATDREGNSYITGYLGGGNNTFGNSTTLSGSGGYAVKYDGSGTALWATKIGSGTTDGLCIAADDGGNTYVTGDMQGTVVFATTPPTTINSIGGQDLFVAKLDPSGAISWVKHFGGGSAKGKGISLDALQNIYVVGDFGGKLILGSDTLNLNNTSGAFVTKLDSTGVPQWAMQSSQGDTYNTGVKATAAGNCYFTGYYYPPFSTPETFCRATFPSIGNQICYVIKVDSTGSGAWSDFTSGQGSSCISSGISLDGSENVYISGNNQGTQVIGTSTITSYGGYDALIAKIGNKAISTSTTVVSTSLKSYESESAFVIYPNPFNSQATLDIKTYTGKGPLELKLFDVLGQEVKSLGPLSGSTATISREGLSKGVYSYRLMDKSAVLKTGKLLVE